MILPLTHHIPMLDEVKIVLADLAEDTSRLVLGKKMTSLSELSPDSCDYARGDDRYKDDQYYEDQYIDQ